MSWQIDKIINVANALHNDGKSGASTAEVIAVAFVLNRPELLPHDYRDIVDAWDRLADWQSYVRIIKCDYMHKIHTPN
jgi:hypothetical protein